ncbi:M28 family peptidase [Bacteroidales bacterium OttesenSCG-928-J19]|nr:M28 family peptidase [Bacteroidales bacterium OttesenSCG-928-J19]
MKTPAIYIVAFVLMLVSCSSNTQKASQPEEKQIEVPTFNPDSALFYTAQQIEFGYRIPNTQAHKDCGDYLTRELKRHGATVTEQNMELYTYNNIRLEARNIIGAFSPEKKSRVLLFAHWDTRPFADQDPDSANHRKPIDGANDSTGACGMLLEMARLIGISQPEIGVDIIFFDAEDWGVPVFERNKYGSGGWCLGSEYWSKNPHTPNYRAKYGILLDMVSAPGALFYKEGISMHYAKHIVEKVWNTAEDLGYGNYFINEAGGYVEDDHTQVNKFRGIPSIDIIQHDPTTETGFGSYWHTLADNLDNVSKETMKAVGQTVLQVIYNE